MRNLEVMVTPGSQYLLTSGEQNTDLNKRSKIRKPRIVYFAFFIYHYAFSRIFSVIVWRQTVIS
jgi:hypothetical protein